MTKLQDEKRYIGGKVYLDGRVAAVAVIGGLSQSQRPQRELLPCEQALLSCMVADSLERLEASALLSIRSGSLCAFYEDAP